MWHPKSKPKWNLLTVTSNCSLSVFIFLMWLKATKRDNNLQCACIKNSFCWWLPLKYQYPDDITVLPVMRTAIITEALCLANAILCPFNILLQNMQARRTQLWNILDYWNKYRRIKSLLEFIETNVLAEQSRRFHLYAVLIKMHISCTLVTLHLNHFRSSPTSCQQRRVWDSGFIVCVCWL